MNSTLRVVAMACVIMLLAACGGGGGGEAATGSGGGGSGETIIGGGGTGTSGGVSDPGASSGDPGIQPIASVGVFLDAPVAGVSYRTETRSGLTNADGEFSYLPGEIVVFSVGAVEFPPVKAAAKVTPLEIVGTGDINHPVVSNMLVFLQTIDSDGDPSNGLQISAATRSAITRPVDFSLTPETFRASAPVRALIANGTTPRAEPVSVADATAHFSETLKRVNVRPVAHAGSNQAVSAGATVLLSGALSSDANGDSLSYRWTVRSRPDGSSASLLNADSVSARFVADRPGNYEVALVVADGTLESEARTVTITAAAGNAVPVANAGLDRTVLVGTTINLDGSRSADADGDPIAYAWSLVSRPPGSAASVGQADSVSPEISLDVEGNYVLSLVVSDGSASSEASQVTLRATRDNVAPIARAGASQNVLAGSTVTLDGSASSDANGDALSYAWAFVSRPSGSAASLSSPASASPGFVADRAGTYVVALVVSDGTATSTASTTTVTAAIGNLPPVADAGLGRNAYVGVPVVLDGTGSYDANGDSLAYLWAFVSRPVGSVATLTGETTAAPAFIPDLPGSYVLALVVGDGSLVSEISTTSVAASPLPVVGGVDLFLFGGYGNSEYLGCLTCNNFHPESVCNRFGTYGNPFSLSSIWNQFGTYGNSFNLLSPWNSFSTSGPIVVGTDGLTYGRFTVNAFQYDRTTVQSLRNVLNFYSSTNNLGSTRSFACGN